MHTGQPNPHSVINEYISGQIVLDRNNIKYVFPSLNVSKNFPTIDYDAHINTKTKNTIDQNFRSSLHDSTRDSLVLLILYVI